MRVLPNYAYRDDAILIHKAVENYVAKIVRHYYGKWYRGGTGVVPGTGKQSALPLSMPDNQKHSLWQCSFLHQHLQ